jgi:hypothetical protein
VTTLDGNDAVRLLLLEDVVRHLTEAGVIDERRVLDGVVDDLAGELDVARAAAARRRLPLAELLEQVRRDRANPSEPADRATALENAYRCLSALRRLEL